MTPGPAKQFDRSEVLHRAMELFWSQGFEGTSLAELLETMQIGRQSFYDTYGDKRSLFLEALGHYFATRGEMAREALSAPGSPLKNLRAMFERFACHSEEAGNCGCFLGNVLAEFGDRDEEVQTLVARHFDMAEGAISETLERAQAVGELRKDLDARSLARTLLTLGQGAALVGKRYGTQTVADTVLDTTFALLEGEKPKRSSV